PDTPPGQRSHAGAPTPTALLVDQQSRWQRGERPLAEAYLDQQPALRAHAEAALDLIAHEVLLRHALGETPPLEEYLRRFPQWASQLRDWFEVNRAIEQGDAPTVGPMPPLASPLAPAEPD